MSITGPAHVLFDVNLDVAEGGLVALIGRNGVGKSTTLKTIMGLAPARSGAILFDGLPLRSLQPFEIARRGVGYVPEERRIFSELTIEENLQVAERPGLWTRTRVYREFPVLEELRRRPAGLLSGGQQQMLTIARSLLGNPRLLLVDEPTEGLAPVVVTALEAVIEGLRRDGPDLPHCRPGPPLRPRGRRPSSRYGQRAAHSPGKRRGCARRRRLHLRSSRRLGPPGRSRLKPAVKEASLLEVPMKDRTLGRVLRLQAERQPRKTFLLFEGTATTYEEADAIVTTLASNLHRHGFRKGDHVAVLMHNHPNMLWTMFALATLGAVAVPINTAAKGEQLLYFLRQSRCSAIAADRALIPQLRAPLRDVPGITRMVVHAGGSPQEEEEGIVRTRLDLGELLAPSGSTALLEPVAFSDVQLIMYTSGTTGPSKGVLCTHSQEQTGGFFMAEQMGYRNDDVLYTCLPLFHANALRVTVNAALWAGATVALARRFSASQFWSDIRSSGATQFNALGAMANIILRNPEQASDLDHRVRLCNVGAGIADRGRPGVLASLRRDSDVHVRQHRILLPDVRGRCAGQKGPNLRPDGAAVRDQDRGRRRLRASARSGGRVGHKGT